TDCLNLRTQRHFGDMRAVPGQKVLHSVDPAWRCAAHRQRPFPATARRAATLPPTLPLRLLAPGGRCPPMPPVGQPLPARPLLGTLVRPSEMNTVQTYPDEPTIRA